VEAAVDVPHALGAEAFVQVGVTADALAGAAVGAAGAATFAVALQGAVELVEVFGGELFEPDPTDARVDVALDGLVVVGQAGGLEREPGEPTP
jgi:hypothetical protein